RSLRIVAVALMAAGALAGAAIAASSPTVATGGVKNVKQTQATLLGTVNPNGSATVYGFQWGLTNAYGSNGRFHTANGTKSLSVSGYPSGLLPGTKYHYRIVAFSH